MKNPTNSILNISPLWSQQWEIGKNVASSFLLCINLTSSIRLLLFRKSNSLIQTIRNCYRFLVFFRSPSTTSSLSSQSAGNFVASFENNLTISSASFLSNSSNFTGSPLLLIKCHSPACLQTSTADPLCFLNILIISHWHQTEYRSAPSYSYSSSRRFRPQAIWHQKLQTVRFTSFQFFPELSDMPAHSISSTEQPVGSLAHCPSMRRHCASTTVDISTREVLANKLDSHWILITSFRKLCLCRSVMADWNSNNVLNLIITSTHIAFVICISMLHCQEPILTGRPQTQLCVSHRLAWHFDYCGLDVTCYSCSSARQSQESFKLTLSSSSK